MPISALPPAPQPTDTQAQFNTKAFNLVAALSTFVTEANAVEAAVDADAAASAASAASAATQAANAANAAATAVAAGTAITASSTTSLSITTGSKTLTIDTGRAFVAGMPVRIGQAGANANVNYMDGDVTSYNAATGELVVDVGSTGGTGTFSSWSVRAANTRLPDQTGNAGKFLTTDGTNASWGLASPSLTAIATGTLSDGSAVVVNSDGTVSVVSGNATSVVGSNSNARVFESASTAYTSIAYDATNQKVVIAYTDQGNANYGTAVVGTVSGTSISFGTPVVFESASTAFISIAYDTTNQKVVIAYQDAGNSSYGTAIVGTVSGTSISFGTPVVFESASTFYISIAYDATNQKVVIAYQDQGNSSYGTAVVGTVSGTSISFGTPVVFESASTAYISIAYDATNQKVVVAYQDQGNSNYGTAVVGTVSGTSISFGTPVVFESASTIYTAIAYDANAQKVVIAYRDGGNSSYGTAIVGTVSGTSISFGTPVVFESANTDYISIAYDANAQKVVIAYQDAGNSSYGTAIVGTVSGTSISFGTPVVFESAITSYTAIAYDATNQKVVIAYRDAGNSSYGTAIVGTVSGTSLVLPVNFSAYTSIAYDANAQKVVIAYQDAGNSSYGTAIVGTVSGTSISFGTPVVFESASTQYVSIAYDATNQKVVIAYTDQGNSSYGTAIVGTVSGTSISFGTPVVFESASATYISIAYDANAQKVVIAYRDGGNSAYGTAIVGTVSGTSISFGTPVVFESASTAYTSIAYDATNQKVVIAYRDDGNSSYGTAIVGTVSGTSISFGTPVVFESASTNEISIAYDANAQKVVIAYQDGGNSNYGTAVVGTVSGTAISFGTPVVFESANINYISIAYDANAQKVVIAYRDQGNSNYGTAVVGTVSGTSIFFGTPVVFESASTTYISIAYDATNQKVVGVYAGRETQFVVTPLKTNLTEQNYIGISAGSYTNGQTATIQIVGAVDDAQTGLTPGLSYYLQPDGSITTTPAEPNLSVFAGTAVASTKLIIKG